MGIARKAYPFRDLEKEDLIDVLKFLEEMSGRLAWLREGEEVFVRPSKGSRIFDYYFNTLSMIPEIKQYLVVDDTQDEAVGVLDEPLSRNTVNPGPNLWLEGHSGR